MKRLIIVLLVFTFIGSTIVCASSEDMDISNIVYQKDITKMIISEINNARESIDVMMFKFDYKPIADALIIAHERGVNVRAIIDERSETFCINGYNVNIFDYLSSHGVDVWVYSDTPNILHYKVVQIDGETSLTGSLNFFTHDILNDYEMFTKIKNPTLYKAFGEQFEKILNDEKTHKYSSENIAALPEPNKYLYRIKDLKKPIKAKVEWIKFSPETDSVGEVIEAIKSAKIRIVLMESMFNNTPIAEELIKAKSRGVNAKVVTNKGYDEFYNYLATNGIDIEVFDSVGTNSLMHHKTILIDYNKVFTGTLNLFDRSLTSDREIMIMLNSPDLNRELSKQFNKIMNDVNCSEYTAAN